MNIDLQALAQILTSFAAVLALILSQLPPIRELIKGKKLHLAVPDRIELSQYFGNTHAHLWVDLENVGGEDITIKEIRCLLKRRGDLVQTLTAKTYWLTYTLAYEKAIQLPISEIALKPKQRWSAYLHLFDTKSWTREIERRTKAVSTRIKDDILNKLKLQQQPPPGTFVEANPEIMREADDIVRTLRKLQVGDYELFVEVYEDTARSPLAVLGFDLNLFEKDVEEIFEPVGDYKYGFEVYYAPRLPLNIPIEIRRKA